MRNCASGMQAIDSAMANIQNGRCATGPGRRRRCPVACAAAVFRGDGALVCPDDAGENHRPEDCGFRQAASIATAVAGDRPAEGADRSGDWSADGADRGKPRLALRHLAAADGSIQRCAATSAPSRRVPPDTSARSCRWLMARARSMTEDDGVRADSSMDGLSPAEAFFRSRYGRVTPGNSSQITDGAAWLLLASRPPSTNGGSSRSAESPTASGPALDPAQMGLGPVHAATPILQRHAVRAR
jgi:acetyl-CoA C-acetyltransferase